MSTTVKRYRKKPVVIEAMQMPSEKDQSAIEEIVEWMSPGLVAFAMTEEAEIDLFDNGPVSDWGVNYLYINTLEGEMNASLGDYIIRGIQGEFYPCKSDIFEATYERVDDDDRTDSVSEVRGDEAS